MKAKDKKADPEAPPPLQRLEAINRAILDSALDCIIMMDATGRVREFNPAAERVFGYSRAEAVGKELAELIIPAALREKHRQGLAHYLKTGEGPVINRRIEINALRRDGSEILVELAVSPCQIEGTAFFTAYLRDITERKRAEDRFRLAVESAPNAMVMVNHQGKIVLVNSQTERLFGYGREELIGQPVEQLVPERFRHAHQGYRAGFAAAPQTRAMGVGRDLYGLRKDGSEVSVEIGLNPIEIEGKNMVLSSIVDITERVRTERRRAAHYAIANLLAGSWTLAEASSQILETLARSGDWVFGAIWLIDGAAQSLHCHATWFPPAERLEKFAVVSRSIHFVRGEGLPGRVWKSEKPTWISDVTKDTNFPRAAPAMTVNLRGGFAFPLYAEGRVNGVIEFFSFKLVQPDEDLLHMVEALGSQIGLFIERRRVEQELQHAKEKAEAASAAKDRFLAMLSHELRTPLTPVLVWADGMVSEPGLSPEVQQGLKMVCRNIELEARLIDDLLDLTRITRGKLKLQRGRADVHELLQHALEIVRSETEDRHLRVAINLEAKRHELLLDAPRLQQVFWNIFRNAYKFTALSGEITVRSWNPNPDTIALEISDNGMGIEPQFLEKIFDAFEQVDSRREGLGLGLAISKVIIEMHGGTITARSEGLGQGATFLIELPIANAN